MEQIEGYKFGQIYNKTIDKEEADRFANIFGEGSKYLTGLIKYCILNDIITLASCKGHPEDKGILERKSETGYITFSFDENYDLLAYFLAALPVRKKGIVSHIENNRDTNRTITLYVPATKKDMSEEYFKYILESIKGYKKEESSINDDIKKIVDYMFSLNSNESFDILYDGYKKFEREGFELKKVAKCPRDVETNILHKRFGKFMKDSNNIEEFINTKHKL